MPDATPATCCNRSPTSVVLHGHDELVDVIVDRSDNGHEYKRAGDQVNNISCFFATVIIYSPLAVIRLASGTLYMHHIIMHHMMA